MNRILCKLTGGHKFVPEPELMKFRHIIDGIYEVKSTCKKCGYIRTDALVLPGNKWIENYERIKAYEDRDTDVADIS